MVTKHQRDKNQIYLYILTLILSYFFLFSNLSQASNSDLRKVTLTLQWTPQAQFAGYYVAYEKGFYQKRGIDLVFRHGGPTITSAEELAQRKTDFATMFLSTAIEDRAKGIPLVNIGQIVQNSALILVAKKSSGITSPKDFNDKNISYESAYASQIMALLREFNVKPRKMIFAFSPNLFLRGGADVASGMWYNEFHYLLSLGLNEEDLYVFFFNQYDALNFPEDGIYCLQETLKKDPKLCQNFAQASIEGWQYALDHPDEAIEITMKHIPNTQWLTNRSHQKWMLEKIEKLIQPDDTPIDIGMLSKKKYLKAANELKKNRVIDQITNYEDFYENCSKK